MEASGSTCAAGAAEQRLQVAEMRHEELRPDGSFRPRPRWLAAALRLQPDVIFFVTDADDLTETQVLDVTKWNAGKVVIHTIELNLANRQLEFKWLQQLGAGASRWPLSGGGPERSDSPGPPDVCHCPDPRI